MTIDLKPAQPWHSTDVSAAEQALDVELARGLSAAEAARRLAEHGPNRLAGKKKEPPSRRHRAPAANLAATRG